MDYLEEIKYRDTADITLEDAKEEILAYEELDDTGCPKLRLQYRAYTLVRCCFCESVKVFL